MAHQEPMKAQLQAAGVSDPAAQKRATALHAPLQARGVPWTRLIDLLSRFGPVVLDVLEELFKDEDQRGADPGAAGTEGSPKAKP